MNTQNLKQFTDLFKSKKIQCVSFILLILFLYSKTIYYDFNLDDYIITDAIAGKTNTLKDVLNIYKLSYNHTDYRPIVLLSYGFEQFIFGSIKPNISHFINCILYFLICISALKLFSILFDKKYNLLLFFAVLLFCIHPLNAEVVCSLKCRDNLLSMLFGINSTIFFLLFLERERKKLLYAFLFIIFSIIAILSKMDALGFLVFNIAYTIFYKRDKKIMYILIAIIIAFITTILVNAIQETAFTNPVAEELKGKVSFTENPLALDFTIINRCIAFANSVYFYFTKLFPVSGFRYYYGYNYYAILAANTISFYGGILILISFTVTLIFALKKQDKILLVSIVAIFILSFYALNFYVPVAGIVADRYVFMANLFFCLFLVYSIQIIFDSLKKTEFTKYAFTTIAFVFLVMSIIRIPAWENFKTLIDTDAPKLYNSYEAMRIASCAYYQEYEKEKNNKTQQSYLQKAIFYAEKGVQVYPKNYLLYLFLGQYYYKNNEPEKAIQSLKTSIQNDTSTIDAFVYLGDAYYSLKNSDSALFYYTSGLNIDSKSQILINNISSIYYETNNKEKCLKFNMDLISKDSTTFAAYENLGYFNLSANDTIKAIEYFKKAIKFGLATNSLPIKI